jgi:hypothetical protein
MIDLRLESEFPRCDKRYQRFMNGLVLTELGFRVFCLPTGGLTKTQFRDIVRGKK